MHLFHHRQQAFVFIDPDKGGEAFKICVITPHGLTHSCWTNI
jgi:hypothetical protein